MAALALTAFLAGCARVQAVPPASPVATEAGHGYEVQSPYLKQPEKAIEMMVKNAEFWKGSYDPKAGGYFTLVSRDGKPADANFKSTLSQSRIAYAFARAYMVTGNREYLTYARRALDFLYAKGWDRKHGGFHTCLSVDGENIDDSSRFDRVNESQYEKWSFMQEYALLGIAAVYDATRNDADWAFLAKGRAELDEKLWDARPGLEGYYETADYDWSHPRGKGFTPTVDAITTHGLSIYLLTGDAKYKARLVELADAIVKHITPTMETRKLGFEEHFDSNWKEDHNPRLFIGHALKAAWCLQRAYLVSPKPEYRAVAEKILRQIWEKGWDHRYGGPYQYANSIAGTVTDAKKVHWVLEQGITAGLTSYRVTGDPLYLEMADDALRFFAEHQYDWKYGEAFDTVSESGDEPMGMDKGSYWKSGYHAMETAYYVYLYGSLYLQKKPAALYYFLDKADRDRTLPLNPIAMEEGALVISEVLHDGKKYAAYDGRARTLTVPAGMAGEFKVTFAPAGK